MISFDDQKIFLMSFIQERIREIQEELDGLYQYLDSNLVNENVFQHLRHSRISPSDASSDNGTERAEVLRKAINSIQLDKGNIPNMNVVLSQLDIVEKSLHGNWKKSANEVPPLWENEELERGISYLEWLFLAKVTISIYGKMLENYLISTLPLSDDIYYWGELEEKRLWNWIHLFQSDLIYVFT